MREHVVVVGAGLSGSLMALFLARRGFRVQVHERRGDPRIGSADDGRSINLGLSQRGISALARAGLLDEVLKLTVPMRGRVVHRQDSGLHFQPYGTNADQILHSVSRNDLSAILLDAAEDMPGVEFVFDSKLTGMDKSVPECRFGDRTVPADVVIGADGAFSAVRSQMQHGEPADYHQKFLPWGYKEFSIPKGPEGQLRSTPDSLHVWPGHDGLVVAHPNPNGSLTATVFLPLDGPNSLATLNTAAGVRSLFRQRFPDILDLVPDAVEQFLANPIGHLVTVRTSPWQHEGKVVLIGDAAHAVYPFYGQGMNSALEDCMTLDDSLARFDGDWAAALRDYQRRRKPHTDVLADLSELNFVELRDRVASPLFFARKKADLVLNRLFPKSWIPLYTMVAHTTTPYADALRRSRRQQAVLTGLGGSLALGTVLAGLAFARRKGGQ